MKSLIIRQFGSSVLRQKTNNLKTEDIKSQSIQQLITSMKQLLINKKLGIGLAAPQVGKSLSLAVIELQKTPLRDTAEGLSLVIINPVITQVFGRKTQMWEGCISSGIDKVGLFAKVPRYKKIKLVYIDENADKQSKIFDGLAAHVIQHEVDHLNGIPFVDKVKDTSSYMTYSEYKKMKKREAK